jgi:hypothetical protein
LHGRHTHVLLMSHAALVITLARGLLGDRTLPLRVGCCSLSKFSRKSEGREVLGGWEAQSLASGSHLENGASRDWGFEDIEISHGKVRYFSESMVLCLNDYSGCRRSWRTRVRDGDRRACGFCLAYPKQAIDCLLQVRVFLSLRL